MRVSRAASKHLIVATVASVLIFSDITAFAQQTRLNVGYVGINSDNVNSFIAKETGIFAKNGLDVQLIYFGGGSIATMALISGETPITQTAGPGIVNAVLNGSDAVMIAGGVTTLDYWMLSRPEIKTAEQLKGGAVAISRFGSASDFIVRYALQRLGLTPVKEVAILQVGPLPDRLAAMETKRVQATVLAPPAMYMAQKRGYNTLPTSPHWASPIRLPVSGQRGSSFASTQTLSADTLRRKSRPCIDSRLIARAASECSQNT